MFVRYIRLRWPVTFMKRWQSLLRKAPFCKFMCSNTNIPSFPNYIGGSQDWTDGASAKECGGAGSVTKWDFEKYRMLRVERFGRHGLGELSHHSCLSNDLHFMMPSPCTDSAVSSLSGYSYWYVFHSIQLFHGALHGGSTLFEWLQGAQQKQEG